MNWIKVEDELPPHSTECLIWCELFKGGSYEIAIGWHDSEEDDVAESYYDVHRWLRYPASINDEGEGMVIETWVTHWMLLPEKP